MNTAGENQMVELWAVNPEHAEIFSKWRQDPHAQAMSPLDDLSLSELKSLLGDAKSDLSIIDRFTSFRWMIRMGDEFVGMISLKDVDHKMWTAEIGYVIAPEQRGKGYATAALRWLVRQIFDQTPLRRLFATTSGNNLASARVLEKVGFQKEGCMRGHVLIQGEP